MKYLLIPVLAVSAHSAFAEKNQCNDIQSCVEVVSKLTGKKYLMDKDVKGTIKLTKNFQITKDNADEFISYGLYMAGYTRLPYSDEEWSIINARDIRYHPAPAYEYGKDKIPKTFDYVTTTIKLKNPYIAPEISRNFRPFMSRYGRIIDLKDPGMLIINDTGQNVHRLINIVQQIDRKPSAKEVEKYEEDRKRWQKQKMLESKNCSGIRDELKEVRSLVLNAKQN